MESNTTDKNLETVELPLTEKFQEQVIAESPNEDVKIPLAPITVPLPQQSGIAIPVETVKHYNYSKIANSQLAIVYISVALQLTSYTFVAPLYPTLRSLFNLGPAGISAMYSSVSLGMAIGTVIMSTISDLLDRQTVMCLQLSGLASGLILQAVCVYIANSGVSFISKDRIFSLFLISRVFTGFFSGYAPVIKAYITDIAHKEHMSTLLSWRESAATASFIVGPLIGGYIAKNNISLAVSMPAICAILNYILVSGFLINSNSKMNNENFLTKRYDISNFGPTLFWWVPRIIFFEIALGQAISGFDTFVAIRISDILKVEATAVGSLTTMAAIAVFLFTACGIVPILHKNIGLVNSWSLAFAFLALGHYNIYYLSSSTCALFSAISHAVGTCLFTATSSVLQSRVIPANTRGTVLGISAMVTNITRTVAPIALSTAHGSKPGLEFYITALICAAASILSLIFSRIPKVMKSLE